MSLSNRIAIVVGVHNLGHDLYWSRVLDSLQLEMPGTMKTCVVKLDESKEKKRKYIAKKETKVKRVKKQIEKVKILMKKQRIDAVRGFTYGSGIGIQNKYPANVVKLESEKKKKLKKSCTWFGCYKGNHKSSRSKICTYHKCGSIQEADLEVGRKMRMLYPSEFGE